MDELAGRLGRRVLGQLEMIRQIGAFTLITFGVTVTKLGVAPQVVRPLIREQIVRSGVRLLPIIAFIGSVFSPYYAWSGRTDPYNHCAINLALYGPRSSRWAMVSSS